MKVIPDPKSVKLSKKLDLGIKATVAVKFVPKGSMTWQGESVLTYFYVLQIQQELQKSGS